MMMTLNFQDVDLTDSDQLARIFARLHVAGIKKVQLQIKSDQVQTLQFVSNLAEQSEMLQRKRLFSVYPLAATAGLSAIVLGLWLWV